MAFLRLDLWICVPFFEDSALQETMYFVTFDWCRNLASLGESDSPILRLAALLSADFETWEFIKILIQYIKLNFFLFKSI